MKSMIVLALQAVQDIENPGQQKYTFKRLLAQTDFGRFKVVLWTIYRWIWWLGMFKYLVCNAQMWHGLHRS